MSCILTAFIQAGREGQIDILRYLPILDKEYEGMLCAIAAHQGHLQCLDILLESGCQWDATL